MPKFIDKENNIKEIDQTMYDIWVETGNPKAQYFTLLADQIEETNVEQLTTSSTIISLNLPSVTALQFRVALLNAGLLSTVEQIINSLDSTSLIKLTWEYGFNFERRALIIVELTKLLDLTEEQMDTLFIDAAKIFVQIKNNAFSNLTH